MVNHSSGIVGSVSILGIHRPVEFLQWSLHPPSQVEVNAADCGPTVNQSSGLSDFSVFCLVKSHRNSDCSSRCCYKYGLNVCGK